MWTTQPTRLPFRRDGPVEAVQDMPAGSEELRLWVELAADACAAACTSTTH